MMKTTRIGCRASLLVTIPCPSRSSVLLLRRYGYKSASEQNQRIDIKFLLSKPTWSVRSLLPHETPTEEITPKQLHHLLRISALPLPTSPEDEAKMLKTLHSQLHFVRDIQTVNTDGVAPLQSIRDETEGGIKEATIGLKDLKETLDKEQVLGRNRRARRPRVSNTPRRLPASWSVFGAAKEMVEVGEAKFFVVRSGKE